MKLTFTLFLTILYVSVFAQRGMVKGIVVDEKSNKPIPEALITIKTAKIAISTDESGVFTISGLRYGSYDATITADGYDDIETSFKVSDKLEDAGEIKMYPTPIKATDVSNDASQATTQDVGDADVVGNSQNVGSALNASRDPFNNAAQYNWGQYFFKQRGYENDQHITYLNGIPMNELEDGGASYNLWGGLNDVFRSRTMTVGLAPNDLTYGGIGNTTTLDASASAQRKGTRITVSNTNRGVYRNRVMATYSTGLLKNGWAFSVSASRRWSETGVLPGTWSSAFSYYLSAEKKVGIHSIGIMAVGAPVKRAKSASAMQELFDITGTNLYNPNWGYQNGQIRNSRILNQFIPLFIITDEIALKNHAKIVASLSYQFGKTSNTGLDYYNSYNPHPDYYNNLPSYAALDENTAGYAATLSNLQNNPNLLQINWDNLYASNRFGGSNIAGISGNRSNFALGADVEQQKRINTAVNYEKAINPHCTFYLGANYLMQSLHNYRQMVDLLGGDYWYNVNGFAERTFGTGAVTSNNLLDANKVVKVGDTYMYNYNLNLNKSQAWSQATFTYNKVDFFLAANVSNTNFQRDGLYQVGLYPLTSYGKSNKNSFVNYGVKAGATYKLNGRNYLYANIANGTSAPFYDNVFISPRTRNEQTNTVQSEKMNSYEAGYLLRTPFVKARVTYYNTSITNSSDIKRLYDAYANSFANVAITNIQKRYNGLEVGAEWKATPTLSINTAMSLTQAYYTNRPNLNAFIDNDSSSASGTEFGSGDVLDIKNFRLPNGPQTAICFGSTYRSPKFWMLSASVNYLGDNYIDFAPSKHVANFIDVLKYTQGEDVYNDFVTQKKLNSFYTVDVSFNKSWRANKIIKKAPAKSLFAISLSIGNLLNNKNIQLTGYEQLRVDKARPTLFAAKYSYGLGTQYYLNLAYSF